MSSYQQSLSSLAPNYVSQSETDISSINMMSKSKAVDFENPDIKPEYVDTKQYVNDNNKQKGNLLSLILWFIIIAVIAGIILALWNPTVVQKNDLNGEPTGELDACKVIIGALIISLIIVIIIYLIRSAGRY